MKQNKLNKHGQPFSKKQKKASRTMMAMRNGFTPRKSTGSSFDMPKDVGMMASIMPFLMRLRSRKKVG